MTDEDLLRVAALLAADLDRRGLSGGGVVRRLARAVAGLDRPDTTRALCRRCRVELTGRQRDWCSERCRSAHRRGVA